MCVTWWVDFLGALRLKKTTTFTVFLKPQKSPKDVLQGPSFIVSSDCDRKVFLGQNYGWNWNSCVPSTSSCLKIKAGLQLSNTFFCTTYLLLLVGYVSLNPGTRRTVDKCAASRKGCHSNQKDIECEDCGKWFRKKCIGMNDKEFIDLSNNPTANWSVLIAYFLA